MYRMKYGVHDSDNTNITVRTMSGKPYYLVTEKDNEVYGDIKDALRPHLDVSPKPARHQLMFLTKDDVEIKDDKTLIISDDKDLQLKVLIKEPEWDDIQQDIIRRMSGEDSTVSNIETPGEMEAFLWSIENNNSMKTLTLFRKTSIASIIDAIRLSSSLESLTITENDITIALLDALRKNTTIQSLTLNNNGMTEIDMVGFSKMIGENTSLRELTISENYIENGMNTLAQSLRLNTSLRKIAIIDCDMIDEDLVEISSLLRENTNTTLQEINFSKNRISDEGVFMLSSSLEENTTLTSLDLSDNNITYKGVSALGDILFDPDMRNTNALQNLILSKNRISDKGAIELASILEKNISITLLDISYNNIGYEGASALAQMIVENTTLKELHLEDNDLTANGRKAIRDALQHNETIEAFYDGMYDE